MSTVLAGTSALLANVSYDFEHRMSLRGRDRETHAFSERLRLRPLTVLSAASGAGKSSLLMAGVYPRLLEKRLNSRVAMTAAMAQGDDLPEMSVLPLIVRNWAAAYPHFAQTLYDRLRAELRNTEAHLSDVAIDMGNARPLQTALEHEKTALGSVLDGVDAFDTLDAPMDQLLALLEKFVGPVAIVLDQLEEVLRDPSQRNEAVAVLRRLAARPASSVHLMLSFRSDLPADAMRALQLRMSIGADEVLDLLPLDTAAAEEVFGQAVDPAGRDSDLRETVRRSVRALSKGGYVMQPELATTCWYLRREGGADIVARLLDEYEAAVAAADVTAVAESAAAARAVTIARMRVITASYEARVNEALGTAAVNQYLSEGCVDSQRRLLVPMLVDIAGLLVDEADVGAPLKVRVPEARLARVAFANQLENSSSGRLASWTMLIEDADALSAEQLATAKNQRQSDLNREAFNALLKCLVDESILKPSRMSEGAFEYELVHDSAGSALLVWAQRQQAAVGYRTDSVQQGVTWDWPANGARDLGEDGSAAARPITTFEQYVRKTGRSDFYDVAWLSCRVGLSDIGVSRSHEASAVSCADMSRDSSTSRRTFIGATSRERVKFVSSSFKRTLFQNCDIHRVTFERCDLSDVVFAGCELEDVEFDRCIMVGAEFKPLVGGARWSSALRNVRFMDCALRGALFDDSLLAAVEMRAGTKRKGFDGVRLHCCDNRVEVNNFYAIMNRCDISDGFTVGADDPAASFSWVGGSLRECILKTDIEISNSVLRVFSVDNCRFSDDRVFRMEDCDGTGMAFIEREVPSDKRVPWTVRATRCNLTGAVFLGAKFDLEVVGGMDWNDSRLLCRGLVIRDAEGVKASFKECELLGLTVDRVSYERLAFERCNLDRSGFYQVSRIDGAGPIEVAACRRNAWQWEPAGREDIFNVVGKMSPNKEVRSFGEDVNF